MVARRRFFPSTTVQTVPGRTVELEMLLKPSAPAPAAVPPPPSGGDAGNGVALLPDVVPFAPEYYYDPESGALLRAGSGLWGQHALRPVFAGWRLVGCYSAIQGPFADDSGKLTYRAVAVGPDAGGVAWTWDLDTPPFPDGAYTSWWDGVEIIVQDGTLKITMLPGELESWLPAWWATLTCIAWSGAAEIGRIVLHPGMNIDDVINLPPPV